MWFDLLTLPGTPGLRAYRTGDLVRRLRRRTGVEFDPHWIWHTAATRMLRDGISLEVVAKLLGHSNVTVTATTYGHLTVEDARAVLEKAGWFDGQQVAW